MGSNLLSFLKLLISINSTDTFDADHTLEHAYGTVVIKYSGNQTLLHKHSGASLHFLQMTTVNQNFKNNKLWQQQKSMLKLGKWSNKIFHFTEFSQWNIIGVCDQTFWFVTNVHITHNIWKLNNEKKVK